MRLVVVANRLPVKIDERQGKFDYSDSPGGIFSSLNAVSQNGLIWVGWPGLDFQEKI